MSFTTPVTSTDASKLVTKNPRSAVRLLFRHLRFVVKSRIVENQFGRPILVTGHPELVLTEEDILSLLRPLKTDGRGWEHPSACRREPLRGHLAKPACDPGPGQFPLTDRRFNSASTASTLCTLTNAATLACRTSRIKSGSLTANSLNVSSMSSGRISRRITFCMSGRLARPSSNAVSSCVSANRGW